MRGTVEAVSVREAKPGRASAGEQRGFTLADRWEHRLSAAQAFETHAMQHAMQRTSTPVQTTQTTHKDPRTTCVELSLSNLPSARRAVRRGFAIATACEFPME